MNTEAFIEQLYTKILGRSSDVGGRIYWVGEIDGGNLNAAQLTEQFILSDEFTGQISPLARLYYAAFNRIPDAAGLLYWIEEAQRGKTLSDIASSFVASPEYTNLYGANSSTSAYLDTLYQNIYNRAPDAAGKEYWMNEMDNNGFSRADVLVSFANAPELINAKNKDIEVILRYHGVTGTAPNQDQINAAVSAADPIGLLTGLYAGSAYQGVTVPGLIKNGVVVDGLISSSTVFIDVDGDGILDSNEQSTTSKAFGDFSFAGRETFVGSLVAQGGVDIGTQKVFDGSYTAPAGAQVITPLTTLLEKMSRSEDLTVSKAEAKLVKALSIPDTVDLLSYNPFRAATTDTDAVAMFALSAKVNLIVNLVGVLLESVNVADTASQGIAAGFNAFSDTLAKGQGSHDLSSASIIKALIEKAVEDNNADSVQIADIAALSADAATVITNLISHIDRIVEAGHANGVAFEEITKLQIVAEELEDDLETAAEEGDITAFITSTSEAALITAVNLASSKLGDVGGDGSSDDSTPKDITGPIIASSTPTDNSVGVPLFNNLIFNFDEEITVGRGIFEIKKASDDSIVEAISAKADEVSIAGTVVTVNLTVELSANTEYYVLIEPGTFVDAVDNEFLGIEDKTTINFTTGAAAPTPVSNVAEWEQADTSGAEAVTVNGAVVLTKAPVNITAAQVGSGKSLTAAVTYVGEVAISGGGTVAITALETAAAADLSGITASVKTAEVNGNVIFTGDLGTFVTTVTAGNTLTISAAKASGKTINGAGTTAVTALEGSASVNLSTITSSTVTAAVGGNVTFTGNLGSAVTTVASGSTLTTTATIAAGKTIAGAGTVAINGLAASSDLSNLTASTVTAAISENMTFTGNLGSATVAIDGGITLTAAAAKVDGNNFAGTGKVNINESAGDQTINGTAADDIIAAGAGADNVNAGAGNDAVTMSVVAGDIDTLDGGAGDADLLRLVGTAAGDITVDLSSATQQFTDGVDSLTQRGFENLDASGVTGATVNVVTIANTSELILAAASGATINGAATVLAINAAALQDTATVTLSGAAMAATLQGLTGTVIATGTSGALTVVTANAADDSISITTGSGNLNLTAVDASDSIAIDAAAMTGSQTITAATGSSQITLSNLTTTGAVNLSGLTSNSIVNAGAGVQNISTGTGNDTVTGGAGQDIISLGSGDDQINFSSAFTAGNTSADIISGWVAGSGSSDRYDIGFDLSNGTTSATSNLSGLSPSTVADNGAASANDVIFLLSGAADQMATSNLATAIANAVTALTSGADFAASNVETGDNLLLVLDDGTDSYLFHYLADATAAVTSAADLELIGIVGANADTAAFVTGDFI